MNLPFFEKLAKSRSILIAGAGGGFDVFAGLPLYLWLQRQGKTVHLANSSFTNLNHCEEQPIPELAVVRPETSGSVEYFPERYLAQWLQARGDANPIYAIQRQGVQSVCAAYRYLFEMLAFDTIVLVDGGTDILMRGDEVGLGTPQEDIASLAATHLLEGPEQKFVACLGFGVDTYHGVCHAHFLENAARLAAAGKYLGSWSLLWEMEEVRLYADAVTFAHNRMPRRPSIVNSSIVNAAKGRFGDVHATERTQDSKLFINPLMTQYWTFDLTSVALQNLYLDKVIATETYLQLSRAIACFHDGLTKQRPWLDLPF